RKYGALRTRASFDHAGADEAYTVAFRQYGIELDSLEPAEAAERIRSRPIWLQLTVALDNWAIMRARLTGWPGKLDDQRWKRLVAVARTADPDEGRNQVRDALERGRSENLSDLVVSAKNGKLPLQTLTFLGEVLNSSPTPGAHDLAVAILRAAQRK